jgi:hypothetical protein
VNLDGIKRTLYTFFTSPWHLLPQVILVLYSLSYSYCQQKSGISLGCHRQSSWEDMVVFESPCQGASLSWCLPGVINLESAACRCCRSHRAIRALHFVFHCLKIFKACRIFFSSYGLSLWPLLLSSQGKVLLRFASLDCRQFKQLWCQGRALYAGPWFWQGWTVRNKMILSKWIVRMRVLWQHFMFGINGRFQLVNWSFEINVNYGWNIMKQVARFTALSGRITEITFVWNSVIKCSLASGIPTCTKRCSIEMVVMCITTVIIIMANLICRVSTTFL